MRLLFLLGLLLGVFVACGGETSDIEIELPVDDQDENEKFIEDVLGKWNYFCCKHSCDLNVPFPRLHCFITAHVARVAQPMLFKWATQLRQSRQQ